jgi:integrase
MRDTVLLKNEDGQNRTLYSLRHTYATFELLRGGTDIHTLSKQMGNSAADRLVGRNVLGATVSRYVKQARAMIENTAAGKFPQL